MRRRERFRADDPRQWMTRARKELGRARLVGDESYWEGPCFNAQQAAEMAIKAVMLERGIDFPYTHNLGRLLAMLERDGEVLPVLVRRATELTPYAVQTRYPGEGVGPVSEEDYWNAVLIATAVVDWGAAICEPRGFRVAGREDPSGDGDDGGQ